MIKTPDCGSCPKCAGWDAVIAIKLIPFDNSVVVRYAKPGRYACQKEYDDIEDVFDSIRGFVEESHKEG